jgi:cytidylate kinase
MENTKVKVVNEIEIDGIKIVREKGTLLPCYNIYIDGKLAGWMLRKQEGMYITLYIKSFTDIHIC